MGNIQYKPWLTYIVHMYVYRTPGRNLVAFLTRALIHFEYHDIDIHIHQRARAYMMKNIHTDTHEP